MTRAIGITRRGLLAGAVAAGMVRIPGARPGGVLAGDAEASLEAGELPRRVLALYKSYELVDVPGGRRRKNPTLSEIHQLAQMPLNWLGLMVDYHDLATGLPDDSIMRRYRGVLTWFQSELMDEP